MVVAETVEAVREVEGRGVQLVVVLEVIRCFMLFKLQKKTV